MSGQLYHPPQRIIQQLLIDLTQVTDPADSGSWPCYVGNMPNTPDNCVMTHDTAGRSEGRVMHGVHIQKYGIQIMVRSGNPYAGYVKADDIARMLSLVHNEEVTVEDETGTGSSWYRVHSVSPASTVLKLGPEQPQSRRHLWSYNCLVSLSLI